MAVNLELHLDHLQISTDLQDSIKTNLERLEEGHHDITGAHMSVKQLSGKPTVNEYEAKLTLYHKPDNIVASSRSRNIPEAVQGAFGSVERQLRKARTAVKDRRRRARKVIPSVSELPPPGPGEFDEE
ncbi:MAG: HPF/RaiA family ribosome-associated protein [Bacteroidetes bacterium]|nr:HPF/RaiA family ribosome-associated protein [Bacteroidota bacterium]MDA1334345.1 HPF/RaiA family ribosome-associated protein [Bacteroidota bacterium]